MTPLEGEEPRLNGRFQDVEAATPQAVPPQQVTSYRGNIAPHGRGPDNRTRVSMRGMRAEAGDRVPQSLLPVLRAGTSEVWDLQALRGAAAYLCEGRVQAVP